MIFFSLVQPALYDILHVDVLSALLRNLDILSRSKTDVPLLLGASKDVSAQTVDSL